MKRTRTQMVLAFFAWVVFSAGSAWGQANFYEGKTLTVMIGAKSGSLEIASQVVAHHLGKYIPGKPTVIVQHMPGAFTGSGANRRSTACHSTNDRPATSTAAVINPPSSE